MFLGEAFGICWYGENVGLFVCGLGHSSEASFVIAGGIAISCGPSNPEENENAGGGMSSSTAKWAAPGSTPSTPSITVVGKVTVIMFHKQKMT